MRRSRWEPELARERQDGTTVNMTVYYILTEDLRDQVRTSAANATSVGAYEPLWQLTSQGSDERLTMLRMRGFLIRTKKSGTAKG